MTEGTALFLLGSTILVGCSEAEERPRTDPPSGTVRTGGPLELPAEDGGVGIYPPRGDPAEWAGSFGGLGLCSDPADVDLRIIGVNVLKTEGVVENFEAFIAERDSDAKGDLLFLSTEGRAPSFKEPYASGMDRKAPYIYQSLKEPVAVDGRCETPEHSTNLVLTFDTNREGGLVTSWEVLYESDGQRYTTGPVPWQVWLCGDSLGREQACR